MIVLVVTVVREGIAMVVVWVRVAVVSVVRMGVTFMVVRVVVLVVLW